MSSSNYVIPFRALLRKIGLDDDLGRETFVVSREQLLTLIGSLLEATPFDEVWYKEKYPDVEQAIAAGTVLSAKDHYLTNGYFEGRWPGPIRVDESFYMSTYPDVAEGIEFGEIELAQMHFEQYGFMEGRLPYCV